MPGRVRAGTGGRRRKPACAGVRRLNVASAGNADRAERAIDPPYKGAERGGHAGAGSSDGLWPRLSGPGEGSAASDRESKDRIRNNEQC